MDTGRIYYDSEGNECSIWKMVRTEPEWAAVRIQEGENAISEVEQLRARIAELEAERVELVKDRERMDWLNGQREDLVAQGQHLQVELHGHGWGIYGQCDTLRQAIDAAREVE